MSRLTLETLRHIVKRRVSGGGFDSLFKELKVLSGGNGNCQCELKIHPALLNINGTLHGGVTASLVDAVSTLAIMTTGKGLPGVSTDLNLSYLKPVKLDETIIIEAKTLTSGKLLAVATVDILSKDSGMLIAQGRHSKFVGQKQ